MDYDDDNIERDGVMVCDRVTSEEMIEEANLIDKYMKSMKKENMMKPASPIPQLEKCEYEKIRDDNTKEKLREMKISGLWTEEELEKMKGYE